MKPLGHVVDAASVAATGSQLGVLELAAEEEMIPRSRGSGKQRWLGKKRRS